MLSNLPADGLNLYSRSPSSELSPQYSVFSFELQVIASKLIQPLNHDGLSRKFWNTHLFLILSSHPVTVLSRRMCASTDLGEVKSDIRSSSLTIPDWRQICLAQAGIAEITAIFAEPPRVATGKECPMEVA